MKSFQNKMPFLAQSRDTPDFADLITPPLQEHACVFICLRVLIFLRVLISENPMCRFPALFVCRNMAELNVDDPSFWFDDVLAARDEDEAIVDECYEAARVKIKNSWYASGGQ